MNTLRVFSYAFDRLNVLKEQCILVEDQEIQSQGSIIRVVEYDFLTKRKTGRLQQAYVMKHERIEDVEGFGNVDKYLLVKI
jgi:hypothetical protein